MRATAHAEKSCLNYMIGGKLDMPKVSAVVPVYNVEKYLTQCIDSALAQTLEDIEIICVDDGSTDGCGTILDEYAAQDSRVKVIHQPNGGYGKAMNAGLDAATGEYFAVLESDDFILPDSYEILYESAKRFDAEVVRADFYFYTTVDGKPNLKLEQVSHDYTWYYRLICPREETEAFRFVMHNWTGIHKLSFLREKGIRYNETPGASYQDNGFYFQVFTQTDRLLYVPRACYAYRYDNPSASIRDPKKVYTMTEEYGYIREYLSRHPEFEQKVMPAYGVRLFRAYNETYHRIDREIRPEYLSFFRGEMLKQRDTYGFDEKVLNRTDRVLLPLLLESEEGYRHGALPKEEQRREDEEALKKAHPIAVRLRNFLTILLNRGWQGVFARLGGS